MYETRQAPITEAADLGKQRQPGHSVEVRQVQDRSAARMAHRRLDQLQLARQDGRHGPTTLAETGEHGLADLLRRRTTGRSRRRHRQMRGHPGVVGNQDFVARIKAYARTRRTRRAHRERDAESQHSQPRGQD